MQWNPTILQLHCLNEAHNVQIVLMFSPFRWREEKYYNIMCEANYQEELWLEIIILPIN